MVKHKKHRGQSAAFMRSINPHLRHSRKSKLNKRSFTMVRHKRKGRKSSVSRQGLMKTLLYAFGYGVVRNPLTNVTTPIVNKVIATPYNDHIGNGVVAYAAMKFGSGMIREVGKVALIAEVASAGTGVNIGNITGSQNSSGYVFN